MSFKPGTLIANQNEPESDNVADVSEVSGTWAGFPALPAHLSTHLLLVLHDEHGAVGVGEDRRAVWAH